MSDYDLITDIELFAELTEGEIDTIRAAASTRAFNRGDVVFTEGDDPQDLYVVVSGRIAIANRSVDGRESVLALMERGDLFGEMALFDRLPRSAEARALEASEALAIPYEPLRQLYEDRPTFAVEGRAAARHTHPQHGRGARRLGVPRRDRPHRQAPARAVGRHRGVLAAHHAGGAGRHGGRVAERVNKAISSFIRLGWIEQNERRYRITNREQLERRAR